MNTEDLSTIITENTYMISDTHFCDYRMLEYEPSRIELANSKNIDDVDRVLIERWNDTVKDDDIVFHLGDFAFKKIETITKQLRGRKIFLRGNHDYKSADTYTKHGFEYVIEHPHFSLNGTTYVETNCQEKLKGCYIKTIMGKKIFFSHFPLFGTEYKDERYKDLKYELEKFYKDFECEINIHGHVHSKTLSNDSKNINVSVENIDFKPILLKTLLEQNLNLDN